jgi:hypothetical protein
MAVRPRRAVGELIEFAPVRAVIAAVIVDPSSAAGLEGDPSLRVDLSDPARFAIWLAARVPESVW